MMNEPYSDAQADAHRLRFWDQFGRYSIVLCPRCPPVGDPCWLHQGRVSVWDRPEDAPEATHVVVDGQAVTHDRSNTGNPSSRRDGLEIEFECEWCGPGIVLEIQQHKGQTLISWRFDAAEPEPAPAPKDLT